MKSALAAVVALFLSFAAHADVRGTVVTLDGKPVAGARVRLFEAMTRAEMLAQLQAGKTVEPVASVAADSKGTFAISVAKPANLVLAITADGFAPSSVRTTGTEDLGGVLLRRAELKRGQVTAGGKPVADAVVLVDSEFPDVQRTDTEGRFSVPDPKIWSPGLSVFHPSYALHSEESQGAYGFAARLDVRLNGGVDVRGKVLSPDGKTGVKAKLAIDGVSMGESAEDGTFSLARVPSNWHRLTASTDDSLATVARSGVSSIRLGKALSLSGQVLEAKTRVPVANAIVNVTPDDSGARPRQTRTNAKGAFIVAALPGIYRLTIEHAGYSTPSLRRMLSATSTPRNIYLQRDARVTGSVFDGQRTPVGAARVRPLLRDGMRFAGVDQLLVSAPDGRYLVRVPASRFESGEIDIEAAKSGYASALDGPHSFKEGDEKRINLTLERGATFSGRVVNAKGEPLPGAAIGALEIPSPRMFVSFRDDWNSLPVTDREGRFSIQLRPATYDVYVHLPGFAPKVQRRVKVDKAMEPIELTLDPAASISGRVVTASGEAVPGLDVQAQVVGPSIGTKTDETGAFFVTGVPAEPVTLYLSNDDWTILEDRTVRAPAENVVIKLAPTVRVSGRVRGKDSRAVRDFSAEIATPQQGTTLMTGGGTSQEFHDANGRFAFERVAVRPSEIVVTAPGFQPGRVLLELKEGKDLEDLEVVLEPAATIRGRVTTATGAPVERAMVSARQKTAQSADNRAMTDADGEYVLEQAPLGEVIVDAMKRGLQNAKKEVTIESTDARVDFQLETGRIVQGRVVSDSGEAISGAAIQAYSPSAGSGARAVSDASGRFQLEGLASATYQLRASRNGFVDAEVREFDAASTPELTVTMSSGATITGTIRGLDPAQVRNVVVTATAPGAYTPGSVDQNGNFRIEAAPVGTVFVRGSLRGATTRVSDTATVETQAGGTHKVDIEFKEHNTVRGRVTRRGAPLTAGDLTFIHANGIAAARVDSTGSYEAIGVRTGEQRILIMDGNNNSRFAVMRTVTGSQTLDIDINPATVKVNVANAATGEPIADASISMESATPIEGFDYLKPTGRTGADGRSVLEDVFAGTYQIRVFKEGFATYLETRGVSDGSQIEVSARLQPSAGLTLRLVDARTGGPLQRGWISARNADGAVLYADSPSPRPDGTLVVPLAPGSYRLNVIVDGLASTYVNVTAPGTEQVTLRPSGTLELANAPIGTRVRIVTSNGAEYNVYPFQSSGPISVVSGQKFHNFAAGSYALQVVDSNNNVTKSYTFDIREGQVTKVTL